MSRSCGEHNKERVNAMTSAEFEQAAKKAAAEALGEEGGICEDDLETVWFAHVLGFKKCLLFAPKKPGCYIEITYNRNR